MFFQINVKSSEIFMEKQVGVILGKVLIVWTHFYILFYLFYFYFLTITENWTKYKGCLSFWLIVIHTPVHWVAFKFISYWLQSCLNVKFFFEFSHCSKVFWVYLKKTNNCNVIDKQGKKRHWCGKRLRAGGMFLFFLSWHTVLV